MAFRETLHSEHDLPDMETPALKPETANALWIFAIALAMTGSLIPNPSGGFLLTTIAAMSAIPAALFGRGRARWGGVIASALSVTLAVAGYPAMQKDQATYTERVREINAAASTPAQRLSGKADSKN
ncbi:MAG: hypothetical protein K9J42_04880 [Sulfuritalea sp.]|nr:hypothetical protein [Sulfuritalea sp.]